MKDKVKRYHFGDLFGGGVDNERPGGDFVKHYDYEALAKRVKELEAVAEYLPIAVILYDYTENSEHEEVQRSRRALRPIIKKAGYLND